MIFQKAKEMWNFCNIFKNLYWTQRWYMKLHVLGRECVSLLFHLLFDPIYKAISKPLFTQQYSQYDHTLFSNLIYWEEHLPNFDKGMSEGYLSALMVCCMNNKFSFIIDFKSRKSKLISVLEINFMALSHKFKI